VDIVQECVLVAPEVGVVVGRGVDVGVDGERLVEVADVEGKESAVADGVLEAMVVALA